VRDEAVVTGVTHRRVEEAVDHQRAGLLVHLVFDRFATHGDFNDDVDVLRDVFSDRDRINTHGKGSVIAEIKSRPAAIFGAVIRGLGPLIHRVFVK